MAKFLNKKEQVYDLKLTSYGRHLLSIGTFKPTYYAFYDDNVIYDIQYTRSGSVEGQNNVNRRVKERTPYLETAIMFRDTEESLSEQSTDALNFEADETPTTTIPDRDILKFESAIGDAMLNGDSRSAPAWKVLMMQGVISSSIHHQGAPFSPAYVGEPRDGILLHSHIPQINISASYTLSVTDSETETNPISARDLSDTTALFADNMVIQLQMEDPILYFEEVNTKTLTENFDIEVFEVVSGSRHGIYTPTLARKYFEKQIPQIENGFMLMETPLSNDEQELTSDSVEYYFDILKDKSVNQTMACQGSEEFNKESYYVSFDFDCEEAATTATFYDIYGSVTEPEICQS